MNRHITTALIPLVDIALFCILIADGRSLRTSNLASFGVAMTLNYLLKIRSTLAADTLRGERCGPHGRGPQWRLPHKDKGEIPVGAVELRDGSLASENELLEWCRQNLAPYKAPRRIWILNAGEMPHNHTGKVLRQKLQERFSGEMD